MKNDSFLANQRSAELQTSVELGQIMSGIVQIVRESITDFACQQMSQSMGSPR
jgi:hypothetical protein